MLGRLALPLAATLAALAIGQAALAAEPAAPSKAELDAGAFHLKVLMGALQSKEIDQPIKNVLFVCLYENPFGKISDATSKVLAGNKLDPKDPNKVLTVMAGVCGLRPGEDGQAPSKTPPKSGPPQQPSSR
ncbi:hypothetical protein J3E64_003127 [Sphingobium sp. OAS761]|uniref:hypothetical protein n=1 Tax=Sphingobium sp. OAS761 TaxID=2817901 RepID=UPI0020A01A47|nr:hypothetical protein [Sphingobium sp. OAS761]MCP1471420.1 hypothetical protein [Sphingobium sp. OAS761]